MKILLAVLGMISVLALIVNGVLAAIAAHDGDSRVFVQNVLNLLYNAAWIFAVIVVWGSV